MEDFKCLIKKCVVLIFLLMIIVMSCMPMLGKDINPLTDASFYLFRNEEVAYRFPDIFQIILGNPVLARVYRLLCLRIVIKM